MHTVLGCVFAEKKAAEKFMGGVAGVSIQTFTNEKLTDNSGDSGAGGNTDHKPDGNTTAEGTETGSADSPSALNNEGGQNTDSGNDTEKQPEGFLPELGAEIAQAAGEEIPKSKGKGKVK